MPLIHQPCPDCGSSDALMINDNGSTFCFSCGRYTPSQEDKHYTVNNDFLKGSVDKIPERCLNLKTCRKYSYRVSTYKNRPIHIATYRDFDGRAVFQKIRFIDTKEFFIIGKTEPLLFGCHLFRGNTKKIIITEGEIDCLSVYQTVGDYPVVSIPNGAQGAAKVIKHNLKWLEQFEEVVFCFDMDEAGSKAVKECAGLISLGKAKIMTLPLKDPNEMLKHNREDELYRATWNAALYRPDGIMFGQELWEDVNKKVEWGYNYPFPTMTKLTYGIRIPEIYAFGAGTGIGKTTLIHEFEYDLAINQKFNVGCIHLESTAGKVALGFMSKYLNKPLHKPDVEVNEEEKKEAFKNTIGTNRVYIYDSKGNRDYDAIKIKIREMVKGYNCKFIFLDHIKAILDSMCCKDEIKEANKIVSDLVQLSLELECTIFIITHLRKQPTSSKTFEEGARVSLDDYYGSGALKQYADFCWGIERNKGDDNPEKRNQMILRCLKDRFTGEADGECVILTYNNKTGRLTEYGQTSEFEPYEEEEGESYF